MSDIKKVISQRLISHEDRTGKKTSLVDIFSALRKNNDARILRHTRLDDTHSTVYITDNKNGYKVYEKKGKGNKVSKKVYKVNNKDKLKNILKKSAKNLKEKFAENNNSNNANNELDLVPDINDNEEQHQGNKNQIPNNPIHNDNNNIKDYEQLIMDDLEKNVVVKKESKKTKKKNKRNRNKKKNKKNKKAEDNKIIVDEKVTNRKTKKRNRRKRKRSRKGKKN